MKCNDYSFTSLLEYCKFLKETAGETKSKSNGRLTACRVVLKDLLPEELKDVRIIDVESAAIKYEATTGSARKTVVEYRNRIILAIEGFVKHVDSLENIQAEEITSESKKITLPSEEKNINEPVSVKAKRYPKALASDLNTISVQIRSNLVAKLILPLDLKPAEAKHLCAIIQALPLNFEEES